MNKLNESNGAAGPQDFSGPMRGCRLCTRQCRLRSAPVGFENKCGRVGSDSGLISSGPSRVGFIFFYYYARRVRVRSDSGRARILGPEKTSTADGAASLCSALRTSPSMMV